MTLKGWMMCVTLAWPFPSMAQEQAAFEPLAGFTLGYESGTGEEFIREYIPDGETVRSWTQMQTHQRFPSWAGGNPIEFLRLLAGDLQSVCPDVGFRVANGSVAGGYPNAAIYGRCPGSPTGPEPEWFVIVAISGDEALHVVQHAWRGAPSDAEFAARFEALRQVPLCQAARSPGVCP